MLLLPRQSVARSAIGELVEVVAAELGGQPARHLVDLAGVVDEVAPAALALDERDLLGLRRARP